MNPKILLFIFLFGICGTVLAYEKPSLSEVLVWKYGYVAGTAQADPNDMSPNPKMVITEWRTTEPKPTDAQIAQFTQDYILHKASLDNEKKLKKDSVLEKLKISEQEWNDLIYV